MLNYKVLSLLEDYYSLIGIYQLRNAGPASALWVSGGIMCLKRGMGVFIPTFYSDILDLLNDGPSLFPRT